MVKFLTGNIYRYRDRFWRPTVFEGLQLVQSALGESYGVDQVSLVSAAFRWLNHHSLMSPDTGGEHPIAPKDSIFHTTLHLSLDAIIIGASCMDHLEANLAACDEGPLDPRQLL